MVKIEMDSVGRKVEVTYKAGQIAKAHFVDYPELEIRINEANRILLFDSIRFALDGSYQPKKVKP